MTKSERKQAFDDFNDGLESYRDSEGRIYYDVTCLDEQTVKTIQQTLLRSIDDAGTAYACGYATGKREALQEQYEAEYLVYSFKSHAKYKVDGRGILYSTYAPHDYKRDECPFLKKDVLIDGALHRAKSVESYAVCPTRKGSEIGILVEVGRE